MVRYGIQQSCFSEEGDASHKSFQLSPEQEAETSTHDFSSPEVGSDATCILQERYEYMKFVYISWALPTPLKNKMLIDHYCIELSRYS